MIAQIYNPVTGEIIRQFSGPKDHIAVNVPDGFAYVEGEASDETHYVDSAGAIQQKGDYVIDALPLPCVVTIEGETYPCTEQPEFSFNYPGTYDIEVYAGVRYLQKTFQYEAT